MVAEADAAELGAATESVVAGASGFVCVFEAELEVVLGSSRRDVCVRNENCEGAAGSVILVDEAVEVIVDDTSVEVGRLDVLLLLGNEMITLLVVVIVLLAAVVVVVLLAETGCVVMGDVVVVVPLPETGVEVVTPDVIVDVELSAGAVVIAVLN